ncbi:MAG: SGNH/GDSL hydrolase family protein [Bacilli bacterium]|nr:SGNH/GDSL hydrolase family protein [Bacilli bacterium]
MKRFLVIIPIILVIVVSLFFILKPKETIEEQPNNSTIPSKENINNDKEDKTDNNNNKNDDEIPTIEVKEALVHTDDINYDKESNLTVSFGKSGGKVSCSDNKLIIGKNDIVCEAIGNNGLKSSISYIINYSLTYNKTAIFFGDSITAGFGSKSRHYSWVNYLANNYDFLKCVNAGITDYRLSTYDDPNKWLSTQVQNHYNDNINYDYIIMQGGVNDLIYDTPIGQLSNGFDLTNFDKNTLYGGLETYLYYVTNKWPKAKIGYIITYYTPNYTERNLKWNYTDYKKYNDAIKNTLNKWNITYLDLFDGTYNNESYSDILKVETKTYLPDGLHLNDNGYNLISPYIYEWLESLKQFK